MNYNKSAVLSDCGAYRYLLERRWDSGYGTVGFIMLNPSTADSYEDDATIRRCVGFAKGWGYRSVAVVNLMAYRATKPGDVPKDPAAAAGTGRDYYLQHFALVCDQIICAWGAKLPSFIDQDYINRTLLLAVGSSRHHFFCLGTTKNGQPKHPVRLAKNTDRQQFNP